jgi:FkbM family methyltransferase
VEPQIRKLARKFLPPGIRKPLGGVAGWFYSNVVCFFEGLIFDYFVRRFRADGCEFEIPRNLTSVTFRAGFLKKDYEAEERELIRTFIRKEDSVLEVGACLGIVSCVTNKLLGDNARHVVVEGNPFCVPAIHRNREINKCGFLVENCALSNHLDVTFYLHPVYIVGGTVQRKSNRPVRVPGRTLKDFDDRYGPFSALVMDIEGAELDALGPAGEILKKYRVVIIEMHEWAIGAENVERCQEILRRAGLHFKARAGATEAWQRD